MLLPGYSEVLAAFRQSVEAVFGPVSGDIVGDGCIYRFRTSQDKSGQKSGWYVLFTDGVPSGSFGSWKTGDWHTWCCVEKDQLSPDELEQVNARTRQQQEQRHQQRKAQQEQTARQCRTWWQQAKAADPGHAYLQTKQVKPYTLRQKDSALLVPLVCDGVLVNLQRIFPDGSKRFAAGGKVSGCYSPLGNDETGPLYICEGWATGATIHALTGAAVACAMNCGNLLPVARALRKRYPDRQMVIAGDNDRFTESNPGKLAAMDAAAEVGAEWMLPDFPNDVPGTDYNDRYLLELKGLL